MSSHCIPIQHTTVTREKESYEAIKLQQRNLRFTNTIIIVCTYEFGRCVLFE